ncbi:MAG: hypothetical protein HC859_10245 [Bacteroidia bacterium]|nr:hypothetical protein [Bacteroidia bacterium]
MNSTQLEHFRNLVSLSAVDGKIEDVERAALSKIAYERGIALDRLNFMLTRASEYVYLIPQNHIDKEKQLKEMIEFAVIDGEFAQAEHDLIVTVGQKLGFDKDQVEAIIRRQTSGIDKA